MHPNHEVPITGDLPLYRRIFHKFVVPDGNSLAGFRISTAAFRNTTDTNEMSVVMSDTLHACNGSAADLLDSKNPKIAALTVQAAWDAGQLVARSPDDPNDGCDAHGSVIGEKTDEVQQSFVD